MISNEKNKKRFKRLYYAVRPIHWNLLGPQRNISIRSLHRNQKHLIGSVDLPARFFPSCQCHQKIIRYVKANAKLILLEQICLCCWPGLKVLTSRHFHLPEKEHSNMKDGEKIGLVIGRMASVLSQHHRVIQVCDLNSRTA